MSFFILLLLLTVSFAKYSYSDKCYRFAGEDSEYLRIFYQYYINKHGIPLSQDIILHQGSLSNPEPGVKYYYHYVLSDCKKNNTSFECTATTDSIWFKITNATSAKEFVYTCDSVFYKKYADITKYNCSLENGDDPFEKLYEQLGIVHSVSVPMENNAPVKPAGSKSAGDCIWEYEILGLWSIVAIVVVSCCVVGALLFIIIIWAIAQKHRSNKRKRLENSLIHSPETRV